MPETTMPSTAAGEASGADSASDDTLTTAATAAVAEAEAVDGAVPSSPSAADAAAAVKAAAAAAYAASGSKLRTKRKPGMVKRSIALHVGYVGTAFNGLQVNREAAPDSTVEAVLETAVYGADLIAESNFGDLKKIKWTRNSRTDKGVHSVSTVVGLRVLLEGDERFDADPEGLEIAAALNARLPPAVRVFSAQRVNKKFNARRFCFDRTYEYLLPSYLLVPPPAASADGGGDGSSGGGAEPTAPAPAASRVLDEAEVAAALGRLREALQCYVGTHPFHNYTARRRDYLIKHEDREARKVARAGADTAAAAAELTAAAEAAVTAAEAEVKAAAAAAEEEALERAAAELAAAALRDPEEESEDDDPRSAGGSKSARQRKREAKEQDDPLEEDDEEDDGSEAVALEEEQHVGPRTWVQTCHWLFETSADKRDRVSVRHFRSITSFTAEDPAPLVPGGIPCVRLRVRGMSFMLHQIRHMIGGALSVARGSLSIDLLRASLAAHARVTVPRAPPHSLTLADCTFPPFRKHSKAGGSDEATVARWSGDRLGLREGGAANLAHFRRESLDPALNELLSHPDYQSFEQVLPRFVWEEQAQQEVIAAHTHWEVVRAEKAKIRAVEKAAEDERAAEEKAAKAAAKAEAAAAAQAAWAAGAEARAAEAAEAAATADTVAAAAEAAGADVVAAAAAEAAVVAAATEAPAA